jgi:hypothetical protein
MHRINVKKKACSCLMICLYILFALLLIRDFSVLMIHCTEERERERERERECVCVCARARAHTLLVSTEDEGSNFIFKYFYICCY